MGRIYYKDQDNKLSSFTDKKSYKLMCVKYPHLVDLTEIEHDEAYAIVNPPPTQEQKINDIERFIVSILEIEMKDKKYFMGFGFKYGRDSVARYPTDPEAIKLTAWQKEVWHKASVWFDSVNSGIEDIDILTQEYIIENLPKVEDF